MKKKKISLLGSTGSIGVNALHVIAANPERYKIVGLSAGGNREKLLHQIEEFKPEIVSISKIEDAQYLKEQLKVKTHIMHGTDGNVAVAEYDEADTVISSIIGKDAIIPTYAAIKKHKTIALAAKEILVSCGEFIMHEAQKHNAAIVPIDSEHSGVFQCLQGEDKATAEKIILTASGGPFIHHTWEQLRSASIHDALKHPNWKMGNKITIDSATLMNKGLELIEAHHLFDLPLSVLDVIIHPQSIIHALIMFTDGSVKAQLSVPDMKIPILYALSYPERLTFNVARLNLIKLKELTFFKPDEERFPCLRLAKAALKEGNSMAVVLNAANDCAVDAFLKERLLFQQIPEVIEESMMHHTNEKIRDIHQALDIDAKAREYTLTVLRGKILC